METEKIKIANKAGLEDKLEYNWDEFIKKICPQENISNQQNSQNNEQK